MIDDHKEDRSNVQNKSNAKRRIYRSFEAHKPRLRSSCPNCGSVCVKRRSRFRDYICDVCGWKGENVVKVEY